MPEGPRGEKRPADAIGRAVMVALLLILASCGADPVDNRLDANRSGEAPGNASAAAPSPAGSIPAPLAALTEADEALFVGFTCIVDHEGAPVFISDAETGAIRYAGRPVRLIRASDRNYDPADDVSLMMESAPEESERLSVTFERRGGAPVSDDATESFTRSVRMTVASGPAQVSLDARLTCAS